MAKTKSTPSIKFTQEDKRWKVEDALRTLQRAEAIKKDASLMKDVKKAALDLNKMVFGENSTSKNK